MEWTEGWAIEAQGAFAMARTLEEAPCPFCRGEGRRSLEVDGVMRVYRCRCQRVPDRVSLYNHAAIPARHAACTMESFKQNLARPSWVAVRKWLDTFSPGRDQLGLVLSGPPGRGKTHLMVAVLRELVFRHGVGVRFVEFSHLIASIREGYDQKLGEARLLGPLVKAPVLAIDELGKGRGSEFESAILDEIVSRRYNAHGGPLLATTNFPLRSEEKSKREGSLSLEAMPSLGERLGERVWSRLMESCRFVELGGDDFRITKGRGAAS